MNIHRTKQAYLFSLAAGATLLMLALLPPLHADSWSKSTKLTFTDSVQIPGHVLPAGTYVFRLWDCSSERHVVQVWDEKDQHLVAMVIAINDYRIDPNRKSIVTFAERSGGPANAIKEWFYPGDSYGQEFVYPKGSDVLQAAQPPVSYTPIPTPAPETPAEPAPTPAAEVTPQETPQPEPQPTPTVTETPTPTPQEPAPAPEPEQLPKTGSELPLVGLLAFGSLGSGWTLRLLRRR